MTRRLLEVRDLATHFFTRAGVVKAVDGVSFAVARRAGGRSRRRVRLGQVGDGLFDPRARRPSRPHRRRFDRLRGAGTHEARCRGAQGHPRPSHLDGVPGRDRDAEPGAVDRNPDAPRGTGARAPVGTGGAGAVPRHPGEGRHSGPGFALRRLSAPALRRHAPARRDRDRAAAPARPHYRGRAHDRARRLRPGSDHSRDARTRPQFRNLDDLDHPRPRDGLEPRRRHPRDVRGPGRRGWADPHHPEDAAPPLHARPSRQRPEPEPARGRASPDRRLDAVAPGPPEGLSVRAALPCGLAGLRGRPAVEFADGREIRCHHPQGLAA